MSSTTQGQMLLSEEKQEPEFQYKTSDLFKPSPQAPPSLFQQLYKDFDKQW